MWKMWKTRGKELCACAVYAGATHRPAGRVAMCVAPRTEQPNVRCSPEILCAFL